MLPSTTKKYLALPQLLTQLRKEQGLLQSELAEKIKKPQSYVSKYERGERRLDVVEFIDICQALNINPEETLRKFIEILD